MYVCMYKETKTEAGRAEVQGHARAGMWVCLCAYMYVCMYVCMYTETKTETGMYVCMYVRMHIFIQRERLRQEELRYKAMQEQVCGFCVYVRICMYVCMYVCMYKETKTEAGRAEVQGHARAGMWFLCLCAYLYLCMYVCMYTET